MENILHIAYRMDFEKWRLDMDEYKDLHKKAKTRIAMFFVRKQN